MGAEQAKEDQRPTSVPNPDQARLIAKLDGLYAKIGKCECRLMEIEAPRLVSPSDSLSDSEDEGRSDEDDDNGEDDNDDEEKEWGRRELWEVQSELYAKIKAHRAKIIKVNSRLQEETDRRRMMDRDHQRSLGIHTRAQTESLCAPHGEHRDARGREKTRFEHGQAQAELAHVTRGESRYFFGEEGRPVAAKSRNDAWALSEAGRLKRHVTGHVRRGNEREELWGKGLYDIQG